MVQIGSWFTLARLSLRKTTSRWGESLTGRRGRRGRRRISRAASRELGRIAAEYEKQLVEIASSRGPVTPESLCDADKRLRRRWRRRGRVSSATWDAATGLGAFGCAAAAYFGGAHPLTAGPLAGFSVSAVVGAGGIVGKWSENRKTRNGS